MPAKPARARDKSPVARAVSKSTAEEDVVEVDPAEKGKADATPAAEKALTAEKADATLAAEKAKQEAAAKKKKDDEEFWSLEFINSEAAVVVVSLLVVIFLFDKWNWDMMAAFYIATLMAHILHYSLFTRTHLKETAVMLVALGVVAGYVVPDKKLNSIESMQKTADKLLHEFANKRTNEAMANECFDIQFKDPQNPYSKEFEQKFGKPFEPANDEDWDKMNTFLGCEITKKCSV